MTDKLKPCPFCGDSGVVYIQDHHSWYRVECSGCDARSDPSCQSKKEAIAAWNTRAIDQKLERIKTLLLEPANIKNGGLGFYYLTKAIAILEEE